MDLDSLLISEDEGVVLELKDPAGEPLLRDGKPVTITLASTASNRWRKAMDAVGDRRIKTANPRNGTIPKSMDEQRNDTAFLLASVTLDWDGVAFDGGQKECNPTNAKALYSHPKLTWITSQVDEFLGEQRNFMKASAKN